ncbi:hypothetical protein ACN9ML_00625 [Dyadobacter endophyticus]|uniref:hypothetical protein n=1 Tax=Dyadobacter TaxID=120831 RepID=UPI003CF956A3
MTRASYEIAANVKAPGGWRPFGYFQVGYDQEKAVAIFEGLQGIPGNHGAALRLELFEHVGDESLLVAHKGCTLDEFTVNSRIIARDVFKYFNLE